MAPKFSNRPPSVTRPYSTPARSFSPPVGETPGKRALIVTAVLIGMSALRTRKTS